MEVMNVRWNGGPEDPAEIHQFGHTFRKGEAVKIHYDKDNPDHVTRIKKLKGNPHFEVKGEKQAEEAALLSNDRPPVDPRPARAPATTYKVAGSKKDGFRVVDENGATVGDNVPFKTAEDAQTAADMLNAPKP